MDTMKATKIVGGVSGSLLVLLLVKWGAELIYAGGGGHGEGAAQAYAIVVPDSDAPVEEVAEVPFEEIYATADAAQGERVFAKCKSCHRASEGDNATGPTMFAIVGRAPGAEPGFGNYSDAMLAVTEPWTPEHLNEFLTRPADAVPGTSMRFSGLPKPEDRANLIAYLATLQ
ncbi:MAG: c-type cytochrome [Paracoccaceae bacterium]